MAPEPSFRGRTTADLIRRIKSGDEKAREHLFARYRPRLRRWATGQLPAWARNGVDTEDLVQDALMRTLDKLGDFELRHGNAFHAWLDTILRNRIHDEIRKARRHPARDPLDSTQVDPAPSPFQGAVGQETRRRYEEALARLRDEDRALILLRVEWGFDYEAIAQETRRPSTHAARMAVTRALVKLAKEMGHGS